MPDTATTHAARQHARSMHGARVDTMPTVPPSATDDLPAGVAAHDMRWEETLTRGGYTSMVLARGSRLRLVDLDGDCCAGVLLHRAGNPAERLNVADTVKVQWQAYLGPGQVLLSDMGRTLATILTDTSQSHDALCGTTNLAANEDRYGDGAVDGPTPNGRDLFALSLAKHGLARRDVAPNVNLFRGVRVGDDGTLELAPAGPAGGEVVLRCDLDLLVTVVNVPHPLDDRPTYTAGRIRVTAWKGEPAAGDDQTRSSTPEVERAHQNTDLAAAAPAVAGGAR